MVLHLLPRKVSFEQIHLISRQMLIRHRQDGPALIVRRAKAVKLVYRND